MVGEVNMQAYDDPDDFPGWANMSDEEWETFLRSMGFVPYDPYGHFQSIEDSPCDQDGDDDDSIMV